MNLQKNAVVSAGIFRQMYGMDALLEKIELKHRLMLSQLAAARIKKISEAERIGLTAALEEIVKFDGQLSAFEAFYAEFVRHALALPATQEAIIPSEALSRVLSFLYARQNIAADSAGQVSSTSGSSTDQTNSATVLNDQTLMKILDGLVLPSEKIRALKFVSTQALRQALPMLTKFSFLQRRELLIAVGRVLKLDNVVSEEEAETLRMLGAIMDCPIPARI